VNQGKDFDNDVFWGQVSERMGNTRGRQQCRIKWYVLISFCSLILPTGWILFVDLMVLWDRTDSLSKTFKNEGQKPRWGQQDAYILVHKYALYLLRPSHNVKSRAITTNVPLSELIH
jgi:hypothetical protein